MLRLVLAALLATCAFAAPSQHLQWPDVFEPCATSSPDFDACAKRNLQKGVTVFSSGLPALDVPPFDPITVPEVLLDYRRDATDGKMIVRNTEARGLKNTDIWDLRTNLSDPSNLVIDVDFRIPALVVKGGYKAQGKVAGFPISGKGDYNISMRDVIGTWGVRGELVTIDGDDYMKVRRVNLLPQVGDMQLYVSNLFTGSDELNKAALRFLNLYWPVFYKELLPFAAEGWDKFLRGQMNKFFLKVPFRTVFPEN